MERYFTEDYSLIIDDFENQSNKMLFDFIERLAVVAARNKVRTVYFHNLGRFDGILLMKYFVHRATYSIKPLMRNNKLYELVVSRGKKEVFRLKDSLNLLSGSLNSLAKTLCPELGSKGSIPIKYEDVDVPALKQYGSELMEYMKQDILLLGGIMHKAQEINWTDYQVDIEDCLTVSALAMKIFRTCYYDPKTFPIHLPSKNEDKFIRKGYYGGHADMYKPYGVKLYHYDVNSLYPHIMASKPMPGGVPVWKRDLRDQDLDSLYGFIEAYVVCPPTMNKPFLPYKEHERLLFPTGRFIGVYFSEELKYARNLGYKILPLKGYLFEEKKSPFEGFVSNLYEKRLEAKKSSHDGMSYVYKILMNSLYGRFGINPESKITEICHKDNIDSMSNRCGFHSADPLTDDYLMVHFVSNSPDAPDYEWHPPRISAVQLSAAITAYARILMYKYISRDDCYYTDTDSAFLGSPLPEEEISSTVLGKLKLEHIVLEGYFVAPKSYALKTKDNVEIVKQKGAAKNYVDFEWFKQLYANPSLKKDVTVESLFKVNLSDLQVEQRESLHQLGINLNNPKRDLIFDEDHVWVDTKPKVITDIKGYEAVIYNFDILRLQDQMKEKEEEIGSLLQEKYDLLSKEHASMHSEIDPNHPDETTQPNLNNPNHPDETTQPNLNNNPTADISLESPTFNSPSRTVEYKLLPTKDNLLKEKGSKPVQGSPVQGSPEDWAHAAQEIKKEKKKNERSPDVGRKGTSSSRAQELKKENINERSPEDWAHAAQELRDDKNKPEAVLVIKSILDSIIRYSIIRGKKKKPP